MSKELNVLELYSGIGGMHCALNLTGLNNAKVVGAVDINHHANLVYKHNFKDTNLIQKIIEGIKLEEFNKLNFDMILMSPPCQPFSRQGNQNGAIDLRSKSFLHLIETIPKLTKKPKFILMENVKGFDLDVTRDKFIEMLRSMNYHYQEFLLSPIQFGIPNSRLRYFLIAKLDEPFKFKTSNEILKNVPEEAYEWIADLNTELKFDLQKIEANLNEHQPPIDASNISVSFESESSSKEIQAYQLNESHLNCSQSGLLVKEVKQLNEFVADSMGNDRTLFITQKQFDSSMNTVDYVGVNSTRTNCFTKNYGRNMYGSGSILKIADNDDDSDPADPLRVDKKWLRFFSPREIANLHCFPNDFEFPGEISTIQGWRLIGNSLNVFIVSILIKLMTK